MKATVTLIREMVTNYLEVPGLFTREEIFNPSPETIEKRKKAEKKERRNWYHEARTANDILIVFSLPNPDTISVGDELEIDLEHVDTDQDVPNLTTGKGVKIRIATKDIHDLHIPMRHGSSRFPSPERRAGN
jgi:hypothetical protein